MIGVITVIEKCSLSRTLFFSHDNMGHMCFFEKFSLIHYVLRIKIKICTNIREITKIFRIITYKGSHKIIA